MRVQSDAEERLRLAYRQPELVPEPEDPLNIANRYIEESKYE